MTRLNTLMRIAFAAWLVAIAVDFLFGTRLLLPVPQTPLAAQLLEAFDHSGLLTAACALALVAGLLLLTGRAVPAALAVTMPIAICALYWALVLNQQFSMTLWMLMGFAANGLLMLANLPAYRALLRGGTLAIGEREGADYGSLFVNPAIPTRGAALVGAALTLAAALAFYKWVVPYANGEMGLLVLIFPTAVLILGAARGLLMREGGRGEAD